MFKEPITDITFEKVENFCKEGVPEGIRLDYKENFPTDLARTIAAFANTYGGLILIGVEETDQATPRWPIKGIPLQRGLNERVTAIALRGIYPPVFPETKVCEFSSEAPEEPNRGVVVIRVQESPDAPHTIENRTRVYIRVDRQNEPYELAEVDKIMELASRRKEASENRRQMIENAFARCGHVLGFDVRDKPARTMIIAPLFPHGPLISSDDAYGMAWERPPNRYWLSAGDPRPVQAGIMFKPYRDTESDFSYMELNLEGLVLYVEGLDEGEKEGYENSVHIGRTIVVIGGAIEYGLECYQRMGFWGLVKIELLLSNILGRRLSTDPRRPPLSPSYTCPDRDIRIEITKSISELREGHPSVVEDFLKKFTWGFGCQLPPEVIEKNVKAALKKG